MSDPVGDSLRWATAHRHFLSHLVVMPAWHKMVILLGGLLAVGGTVGRMAASANPSGGAHVSTPSGPPPPVGSSGFAADAPASTSTPANVEVDEPSGPVGRVSPHMQRVGLSVVLGFVLGWFFRAFIKTMALLTVIVGGGVWLLSHFNILHLSDANLDQIKDRTADTAGWLGAKATYYKDLAVAHLPSSTAGTFGAFLGLRRR